MTTIQKIRKVMGLPQTKLYAEGRLDDGRVIVTEAESWDVGVEVRILDDSGNATPLDAGTYTLEDGTKLVVNEDSRLASLGEDEIEVEIEMELETIPEAEEEGYKDGIADEKEDEKEELDYDKVRDVLAERFPDLEESVRDAIAQVVSDIYKDNTEDVAVDVVSEELSKTLEQAFSSISKRLEKLEDVPASKGVTHSPNKLSSQHKEKDLTKLNGVDRALHIIQNSQR